MRRLLPGHRKLGLRTFLMGALLLVLLPGVAVSGWMSWRNAEQSAEQFTRALAHEVSARIQDQVVGFFDVPSRIAPRNAARLQAGLLDHQHRDALSQLGAFLNTLSESHSGVMFVAESSGQLLASSTTEPVYRVDHDQTLRTTLSASRSPLIRAAGTAIAQAAQSAGHTATTINGEPFLIDWRTHTLPQGQNLTIGVILPQAPFDAATQQVLRNIIALMLTATLLSFLISLLATDWVSRPLASLSKLSGDLAAGHWRTTPANPSPIHEVAALFSAMDAMANQMKRYTDDLEQLVRQRTKELEVANSKLLAEREISEAARLDAEWANQAKSKFLAAASHDLRQPAQAQGLFLEVLSHTSLDAQQRRLLDHVRAASSASADMLDTLLDFSRIEAGVVTPKLQAIHLQTLLNKIEREFGPQADIKHLVYRTRETRLVARSDPALLELVLRNLVSNAIRYTRRGGLLVACRQRGALVHLEVWDTGVGIPLEQQRDVFREFLQLSNPERDRRKGLGLGLAIADGLAQRLEHPLTLVSQPGRGSVFRLTLPRVNESPPMIALAAPSTAQLHNIRVLVIDDDTAVQSGLQQLLTHWGCQCDTAESTEEALSIARTYPPDVVISDYRLREQQTGADAIAALRAQRTTPLPALLITGDTAPQRLIQAQASGMTLLHKPVQPEVLRQALLAMLAATTAA